MFYCSILHTYLRVDESNRMLLLAPQTIDQSFVWRMKPKGFYHNLKELWYGVAWYYNWILHCICSFCTTQKHWNNVQTFCSTSVQQTCFRTSGVRRQFSWGGFIRWHRVVICICCALFVTSQFDVIVLIPNQRFSEVRWHNGTFFYTSTLLILCVIALNITY